MFHRKEGNELNGQHLKSKSSSVLDLPRWLWAVAVLLTQQEAETSAEVASMAPASNNEMIQNISWDLRRRDKPGNQTDLVQTLSFITGMGLSQAESLSKPQIPACGNLDTVNHMVLVALTGCVGVADPGRIWSQQVLDMVVSLLSLLGAVSSFGFLPISILANASLSVGSGTHCPVWAALFWASHWSNNRKISQWWSHLCPQMKKQTLPDIELQTMHTLW